MVKRVLFALLLLPTALFAQDGPLAGDNPLAELKEEVTRVLSAAKLPFTEDQERAIALMMEDRRKASEELFGSLTDFSAGPTQGQDEDRLRSAIGWMRNEFLAQLQNFLTPEQNTIWTPLPRDPKTSGGRRAGARSAADPVRAHQQQPLYRGRQPICAWRRRAWDGDHSARAEPAPSTVTRSSWSRTKR